MNELFIGEKIIPPTTFEEVYNTTASTNISDKITIRTANTMKKVLEISKR